MFHNRPEIECQHELQILHQISTAKCNDVENGLTDRVEHDVRLRTLVPIEVAVLDVNVRPIAELFEVNPNRVLRQELGT